MKIIKTLLKTDLRGRIFFSLAMIILFRILSYIPVPYVDTKDIVAAGEESLLGLMNLFSGGALQKFTFMATGISAYISASIIIQLLSYFVPSVHMLVRSPGGDRKVKKITIALGIICAFFSSLMMTWTMNKYFGILTDNSWYVYLTIAVLHSVGTGIAVWIGESITEKGFGNGMSLLVCINVISSIPNTISIIKTGKEIFPIITMILFIVVIILLTIVAETSERKIPLFYPKAAARGQISKDNMFFPVKLNLSGVMPIILAGYVMQLVSFLGKMDNVVGKGFAWFGYNTLQHTILFTILIFGATYLYSMISFNAKEVAENIQKNGAIIPTIRQGKDTADYISKVRDSITKLSSIYLSFVYFVPTVILTALGVNYISATSIIILVGVSIETCKALKVEIEMRNLRRL